MLYLDTSFVTPLILPEASSERIHRFLSQPRTIPLAVSHWTRVEFLSLLARDVRMGLLAPSAATRADTQFEAIVTETFVVLLPTAADFDLCKQYLGRFASGLRAGDALHLAIATHHNVSGFYSFDRKLQKAARHAGLQVNAGIRAP
jgi:predicted nucleic acid-binding protein